MKISYVSLCGFRGYRTAIRIDLGSAFTILEGRNGVGKSTLFDAVEFALTGTLTKYGKIKADGETVADYIWWTGEGPLPEDRYVEVGFLDNDETISIRRTQVSGPEQGALHRITAALCDLTLAPMDSLAQLVSTAIIRDEHIASLSLDLKETDRYELLRSGLGSNDAERWIDRAAQISQIAKKRVAAVQQELVLASSELSSASRRLDEVRASVVADSALSEAVQRLRAFAKSEAAPDRLIGPVRERVAAVNLEIEALNTLANRWKAAELDRVRLPELETARANAAAERDAATAAVEAMGPEKPASEASSLATKARDLVALANLGRHLGLQDGHCPLCAKPQDSSSFERGIEAAEQLARQLDASAAQQAADDAARATAQNRVGAAVRAVEDTVVALTRLRAALESFDKDWAARGLAQTVSPNDVAARMEVLRQQLEQVQRDIRILETLRLSSELERAQRTESVAKDKLARLQERAGRGRKAEAAANAIHDAARRAAGETLDRRLERVLPLMSELYRRLRPHPIWRDIEYSIRGDVRRFLKLKVGDELNPQFLFSSGQRRSTGLAFLLSVNMALTWNRWRTIMLDDPVQHVDDFRTVHLAELLAVLVAEGRQVVCAVEDAALASLLCRRLPVKKAGEGRRIILGPNKEGNLAVEVAQDLLPHITHSLLSQSPSAAVSS